MSRRPWAVGLLALFSAGCSERVFLEVPLSAEDGLVAVVFDDLGQAVETRRLDDGGAVVEFQVEAAQSVILFRLPKRDFVDLLGGAPNAEQWAGFEAVLAEDASMSGACGRCQVPSALPPQTVVAGDRCRIPSWAESHVSLGDGLELDAAEREALSESARRQADLVWPGTCDCSPAKTPERSNVEVCALDAGAAALSARFLTISDAGTVFAATPGFVSRSPASGGSKVVAFDPAQPGLDLIAPTPDDGVLLVGSRQGALARENAPVRYFDAELNALPVSGSPPIRTEFLAFRPNGRMVISGRLSRNAAVFDCAATFDERSLGLDCAPYLLESGATCPLLNLQATGLAVFTGSRGDDILVTNLGVVAQRRAESMTFQCVPQTGRSDILWTLSATVSFESPELLGVHSIAPDQFLAVVSAGGDIPVGELKAALVHGHLQRLADGTPTLVRYTLLEVAIAPDEIEANFAPLPGTVPTVAVTRTLAGERLATVYELNALLRANRVDWSAPSPPRTLYPEIVRSLGVSRASPNGRWIVLADKESGLHRATATATTPWVSLGERMPSLAAESGVVAELDEDSALAVSELGVFRVRPGARCSNDEVLSLPVEGPLPEKPVRLLRLAKDEPRYLIVGRRELGRLDLATNEARVIRAADPSAAWVTAAALSPERLVLLNEAGELYLLDEQDRLRRLPVDASAAEPILYLSLGGQDGLLFAGAYDRLDRLRLIQNDEVRVESVLLDAAREDWDALIPERRRAAYVTAFGPRCRSHLLFQTAENLTVGSSLNVSDSLRLFELDSNAEQTRISNPESFENFSEALPDGQGTLAQIVWLHDQPLSVYPDPEGAFIYAYGTEPRALPFASATSSARAGDWVVTAGGRLVRLEGGTRAHSDAGLLWKSTDGFRLAKSRIVSNSPR